MVEEVSKAAYVKHLAAIEGHRLLVVWRWIELHEEDENPEADAGYIRGKGESLSMDIDLEDEAPVELELSTVTFKCIGVTRNPLYQEALISANQLIQDGETVNNNY